MEELFARVTIAEFGGFVSFYSGMAEESSPLFLSLLPFPVPSPKKNDTWLLRNVHCSNISYPIGFKRLRKTY